VNVGDCNDVGLAAASASRGTAAGGIGEDDMSLFTEGTTLLFLGGGRGGDVDSPDLLPHTGDDVTKDLEPTGVWPSEGDTMAADERGRKIGSPECFFSTSTLAVGACWWSRRGEITVERWHDNGADTERTYNSTSIFIEANIQLYSQNDHRLLSYYTKNYLSAL